MSVIDFTPKMPFIDFTPQNIYIDDVTSHNHTKPVLNCSTIKAKIYNVSLKKSGQEYKYNNEDVVVQWYNDYCDWIQINDIFFDNPQIPIDLLSQIAEFMLDNTNYTVCQDCIH